MIIIDWKTAKLEMRLIMKLARNSDYRTVVLKSIHRISYINGHKRALCSCVPALYGLVQRCSSEERMTYDQSGRAALSNDVWYIAMSILDNPLTIGQRLQYENQVNYEEYWESHEPPHPPLHPKYGNPPTPRCTSRWMSGEVNKRRVRRGKCHKEGLKFWV